MAQEQNIIETLERSIKRSRRFFNFNPKPKKAHMFQPILRIEKQPDRSIWWEILRCGHRGRMACGPDRIYAPANVSEVLSRRCYECVKERHNGQTKGSI